MSHFSMEGTPNDVPVASGSSTTLDVPMSPATLPSSRRVTRSIQSMKLTPVPKARPAAAVKRASKAEGALPAKAIAKGTGSAKGKEKEGALVQVSRSSKTKSGGGAKAALIGPGMPGASGTSKAGKAKPVGIKPKPPSSPKQPSPPPVQLDALVPEATPTKKKSTRARKVSGWRVVKPPPTQGRERTTLPPSVTPRIWTGSRTELHAVLSPLAKHTNGIAWEGCEVPVVVFDGSKGPSDGGLGKWDGDAWTGRTLEFSM
ncbi:hypothetical protein BV25DRAFT_1435684 [Artomyces pyxidatus]|uniref:Uncharacterized protein n=1 Tax=Artomyces pyxidatus TaxID=48021 RepID=A0ACB8SNA6_9AGAM|nr:hypothetical protein BV25DRAFT_1435684 [Artomyces pyxidatus]